MRTPRQAAPLRSRFGPGALLAVAVLLLAGCEDINEVYTLNPDGSGKVEFVINGILPQRLVMGNPYQGLQGLATDPTKAIPPLDDLVAAAIRNYGESNGRESLIQWVDRVGDLRASKNEQGLYTIQGTAYFKPDALRGEENGNAYGGLMLSMWNLRPRIQPAGENRFALQLFKRSRDADGESTKPTPPDPMPSDEQIQQYIAFMRPILLGGLDDLQQQFANRRAQATRRTTTLHLPGKPVESVGFETNGDARNDGLGIAPEGAFTLRRVTRENEVYDWVRQRLEQNETWIALVKEGRPLGGAFGAVNALSKDYPLPRVVVDVEGAAPLFDYAAEVKAAAENTTPLIQKVMNDNLDLPGSPRLVEGQNLPVAIVSAGYQLPGSPETQRALTLDPFGNNHYGTPNKGWNLQLTGAPIPARAFNATGVVLTELKDADGKDLLALGENRHTWAHLNGRTDEARFPALRRNRWYGNQIPHVTLSIQNLPLDKDNPKLSVIKGRITFRVSRGVDVVETEPFEIRPGAVARAGNDERGVELVEVGAERKTLKFKTWFPSGDLYIGAAVVSENGAPLGQGNQGYNHRAMNTYEHTETFNEPYEGRAKLVLYVRKGAYRVVSPFELRDVDLANPPALVIPPDVARVGDAADDPDAFPVEIATETPRIPRLPAQRDLPMALLSTAYNAGALTPQEASQAGANLNPPGWAVALYGAPLPARTFQASEARINEVVLADGTPVVLDDQTARVAQVQLLNNPYDNEQNRRRMWGNQNEEQPFRLPLLQLTLNRLPLQRDQHKLARLAGTVTLATFLREDREDLGEIVLKDKTSLKPRGFTVENVHNNRRNISFTFDGQRNLIAGIFLMDGEREIRPQHMNFWDRGTGQVQAQLYFDENVPERVGLQLAVRQGVKIVDVPFVLENVDLNDPAALPDPLADAAGPYTDDDADRAEVLAALAKNGPAGLPRIPRLAAQRPLPVAVMATAFNARELENRRVQELGLGNLPEPGREIRLYGSPLPARTWATQNGKLQKIVLDGGREFPVPDATFSVELRNNLYDVNRRVDPAQPVRLPVVQMTLPRLGLAADQTKLALLRGVFTARTFAKEEKHDLGKIELARDAGVKERNFKVTQADNNNRNLTFEFDGTRAAFAHLEISDGDNAFRPNNINIDERDNGRRLRVRMHFNTNLPQAVNVALHERVGLRDVEVPFELADLDLLAPSPLPDPAEDAQGRFVDDEEDVADVLQAIRDEIERRQKEEKERQEREAREKEKPQNAVVTPPAPVAVNPEEVEVF